MPSRSPNPFVIRIDPHGWNDAARDMRTRLQTWKWPDAASLDRASVVLDFSGVSAMEPWAVAMFAGYGLWLRERGRQVAVRLDASNACHRRLQQMGLTSLLAGGPAEIADDGPADSTGLHIIRTHADVTRFVAGATTLGGGALPDTLDALRYAVAELARNIVQHAASPAGGVALAQYFPDSRAVQVAFCDAGRGVFDALRGNYPELRTNLESLKLAILPHVSGSAPSGPYGGSQNAGLGLFFCKEICWRTGGSFWLASHDALLGVSDNDMTGRGRTYRRINPWPGTLVVMHLPDQDVVAFDELLGVCRELSAQARREAGPAALDFVDEQADLPTEMPVVEVAAFLEDVEQAAAVREKQIRPAIERGDQTILDFGGARFVTQSFAHALLHDIFRIPGSLTKLIFRRCTRGTEEAIRLVAAYSATYRQKEL